jgi:hypothetical protein
MVRNIEDEAHRRILRVPGLILGLYAHEVLTSNLHSRIGGGELRPPTLTFYSPFTRLGWQSAARRGRH